MCVCVCVVFLVLTKKNLVEADVGIIIGKDTSLLDALDNFGYAVEQNINQPSTLYRVDDWDQINQLLQQHQ